MPASESNEKPSEHFIQLGSSLLLLTGSRCFAVLPSVHAKYHSVPGHGLLITTLIVLSCVEDMSGKS